MGAPAAHDAWANRSILKLRACLAEELTIGGDGGGRCRESAPADGIQHDAYCCSCGGGEGQRQKGRRGNRSGMIQEEAALRALQGESGGGGDLCQTLQHLILDF